MTAKGVGYACRIDGNMNAEIYTDILDDYLLETIKYYKLDNGKVIFQQDNDSKHTSCLARQWLDNNGIEVLGWPAQSPDLNLMEHLWEHLKRKLAEYKTEPSGILELWERVEVEWDKITTDVYINLIESMPRCIIAVLKLEVDIQSIEQICIYISINASRKTGKMICSPLKAHYFLNIYFFIIK